MDTTPQPQFLGYFKKGDTVSFKLPIRDKATQAPVTGAAQHFTCKGRYQDRSFATEFNISETDVPGTYLFEASNSSSWPEECKIMFDVRFDDGVHVSHSATLEFYVMRTET